MNITDAVPVSQHKNAKLSLENTANKLVWLIDKSSQLSINQTAFDFERDGRKYSRDYDIKFSQDGVSFSIRYGICHCFLHQLSIKFKSEIFLSYPKYSGYYYYPLSAGLEEYEFMIDNGLAFTCNPERLELAKHSLGCIRNLLRKEGY